MKKFFVLIMVMIMFLGTSTALSDNKNIINSITVSGVEYRLDTNGNYVPVVLNEDKSIGYIKYYDTKTKVWINAPEKNNDGYGHRIWFTCSLAKYPWSVWNTNFTKAQWEAMTKTWFEVQISVPEGAFTRLWVYAWKQGTTTHEGGYLLELGSGFYQFEVKDGEIQNWANDSTIAIVDLNRIFQQKREGNVNVKNALAFKAITANLVEKIPKDLKYQEVIVGPVTSTKP